MFDTPPQILEAKPLLNDQYRMNGRRLIREFRLGGLVINAYVDIDDGVEVGKDLKGEWWRAYLRGQRPSTQSKPKPAIRSVDLFGGPGGLANGISQFFAEAGHRMVSDLVVDQDVEATRVYAANHSTLRTLSTSVSNLVDFSLRRTTHSTSFHYDPELTDPSLQEALKGVEVVFAGPPCQGHSNLNNHTRRDDPRNALYLTVPAFAVAIGAPVVIIENVPAVVHDVKNVVGTTKALLESRGYQVVSGIISAARLGWPQTRRRHFFIARKDKAPMPLDEVVRSLGDSTPRSVWWAIHDLEGAPSVDAVSEFTTVSPENQARINWLFENDAHDLALPQRPKSHQDGTTYTSVYGRMRKDHPAPTITTGFMSPGRGRYVHPTQPRVLTAREAARIQGFPDAYRFIVDSSTPPARASLAKWIGDAVPMPLGYAAAVAAYGSGLPDLPRTREF